MKTLKYLTLVALTIIIAACGGPKDTTKELNISNAEVLGDSADIVSIVDGTYTLAGTVTTDITQTLTIKLKLHLEKPVKDNGFNIIGWKVDLLDANGTSLYDEIALKDEECSKLKKFLTNGKEGDEEEFTFSGSIANGDLYQKIMEKATNISLNDVTLYVEPTYTSTTDDSSSTMDEDTSDGENNWDELLDSYEEYVNEYAELLKKAQDGDMDALSEYPTYLKKAQELGEKFANAKGNMTTEQWARYTKILADMTKNMQ